MKLLMLKQMLLLSCCTVLLSCGENKQASDNPPAPLKEQDVSLRKLTPAFKEYWHDGKAEITSYQLTQERYGELHEGTVVTIFVTEDFLPEEQVKANTYAETNLPVLKLNITKNFNTGIYPYTIMTSTFSPTTTTGHALKIANSIQEWCGQQYMQLNNRNDFEIISHSYFEGKANQNIKLPKTWLEDELWNLIRINPEELPTGEILMIPSFEYLTMRHKNIEGQQAYANLKQGDSLSMYTISYTGLKREITLYFTSTFPYKIERWEETNGSTVNDTLRLKTTAVKMKRLKTEYWTQNKNKFMYLRDTLQIK